jgi:DNA-binding CsgD family transcriptional regulator
MTVPTPGHLGSGPRYRVPHEVLHAVIDTAAVLQVRRSEVAAALVRGQACNARVVARGLSGINDWMREDIKAWRDLLSVRPAATVAELRVSVPYNRWLVERGLGMVSLFDWHGLDPASRQLIAGERLGEYRFGVGPVQMKIVDRRYVLLQGPFVEGEMTLMAVTAADCLEAAWRYWHAALAASYPAAEELHDLGQLTQRQRQVAALLAEDARDEVIAEVLGVSVRTVRSDLAHLMEVLGVRSRFAAGARFRELVGG